MTKLLKIIVSIFIFVLCFSTFAISNVNADPITIQNNKNQQPGGPPAGGTVTRPIIKVKGTSGTFVLPPKVANTRTHFGKKQVEQMLSSGKTKWINIKNGKLAEKTHPVTKVPFDKKGFPKFNSKATITLPDKYLKSTNKTQFKQANKALYKKRNQYNFSSSDIKRLKKGLNPKGYTWHHHQDRGKMQLVKTGIHEKTGHTGGKSIWGKNN